MEILSRDCLKEYYLWIMQEYINENKNKINVIYNVPYSPQFNPIEYYHGVLKKEIYQTYIESRDQLNERISKCNNELNKKGFDKYYDKTLNNLKNSVNGDTYMRLYCVAFKFGSL